MKDQMRVGCGKRACCSVVMDYRLTLNILHTKKIQKKLLSLYLVYCKNKKSRVTIYYLEGFGEGVKK